MHDVPDRLLTKLQQIADQFEQLDAQLADPAIAADHDKLRELSIARAAIADTVEGYRQWLALQQQIEQNQQLAADASEPELAELARAELPALRDQAQQLMQHITSQLVTADDRAVGAVILELRAGTGGAEAALWAGDLLNMYQQYAATKGWPLQMMDFSPGEQGGLRHAVASVRGLGVWQCLGYEGGVHCVKRVPATESQGRVHTSTATVAVLPEPRAVEVNIPDSDVQIHITTAQGPGGQNVNKVATAVHMIHKPTGIEVRMQESKSQHQNRERAWQLLRARVFDHHQRQAEAQRAQSRSSMIGSGARSERIRTYRFKDNIVVDHRLGRSFNLQTILQGQLDEMVDALSAQDQAQRLAAL